MQNKQKISCQHSSIPTRFDDMAGSGTPLLSLFITSRLINTLFTVPLKPPHQVGQETNFYLYYVVIVYIIAIIDFTVKINTVYRILVVDN